MKQKYTYVWVSLIILVFGIIFIPKIVQRVKEGTVVKNDRINLKDNSQELAYILLNGKKRRVPTFSFVDQDSLLITDKDYKGKVFVVEFFFTSCPSICPIMTNNLITLQEEFGGSNQFGIASFSITPEYDTPQVLKEYAEKHGITDMNWHLMTGNVEDVFELANSGFNIYAAEAPNVPGGFEHSGLFALVDKKGYLRSRVDDYGNPIVYYRGAITVGERQNEEGETEQMTALKEDIIKLLNE
ncbi:MAG: SCO family protein [Flavobacteriaceae bacterium]